MEIHVQSSDWYRHGHEGDKGYDAVILHVVWIDDVPVFQRSNKPLPTLSLKSIVPESVLTSYSSLFSLGMKWIPCEGKLGELESIKLKIWKERLFYERMEMRSEKMKDHLDKNKNNWEATLFYFLSESFGLKINREAFAEMARRTGWTRVHKCSGSSFDLESLFMGQAGLLDPGQGPYAARLKSRYEQLRIKYPDLDPISSQVQFFRLRFSYPATFTTCKFVP